MTNNPDFLIVYGTLRPPFDNTFAQYLRQRGRNVGEGLFKGQAFDMGSYPGAIYNEASITQVHGTVFNISNQKSAILTYLDYYEGVGEDFEQPTEFIRAIVPVQFNDATTDCWVYLYNLSTDDKPLIESGDYSKHMGDPYKSPA
ncbi:gamma-glutamylcyclotransferase [Spirosoma sp. KCTC 42546]|uniref:gamma-glutamylcyclotransferase family protein n=1 Tax=Spirosoma sp. KCTC 42546 TaxID=2520506 RepID=UPI00115A047B|nr:gamma-glutamylcyclotransferase family protein [Spirosoma sp. KCTC 42546]QDK83503.1 gamma-glutamylcyclotransferase [Spirosoma sp. KCTC 42546]